MTIIILKAFTQKDIIIAEINPNPIKVILMIYADDIPTSIKLIVALNLLLRI